MAVGAVIVVGGGISGIQAALDLAGSGFKVYLVEEGPAIGGKMAQLDKTFPTNDCSMCILSPKFLECERNPNIEILTFTQVVKIEGKAGSFKIRLLKKPRYIDEELCNNCGLCMEYCILKIPDAYNLNLSTTHCLHMYFPQVIPAQPFIDPKCLFLTMEECRICPTLCLRKAIDLHQKERVLEIEVGAVILAPGYETFDPINNQYGYGKFKNVITSLEFERILSASGPSNGQIYRPSDRKEPSRIAWIQCVGSRDLSIGRGYCSSVCCMYATKQAFIAKGHLKHMQPTIFYMDLRAYGKDFHKYYELAKTHGVRYIRTKVASTNEIENTKNLRLGYVLEDDCFREEEFDLVVLSVGLSPSRGLSGLSRRFSIELNKYGFIKTLPLSPISTTRTGIYACGVATGPKDIPKSVIEASAAASKAAELISSARFTQFKEQEVIPQADVRDKEPRIGVFICNCGANIASVVDVKEVVSYVQTLSDVVYATDSLFACSQDNQEIIKEKVKEYDLNRIVVAGCTPRTHESIFRQTLEQAGLNPFLFEMANIREQCSWVHQNYPARATKKAKDVVRMALANSRLLEPLDRRYIKPRHSGLIIGGGLAGLVSALNLAEQGFEVHLVERTDGLGGRAKRMYHTLEGFEVQRYLKGLINKVIKQPAIHVYTHATIKGVSGSVGNFKSQIELNGWKIKEISHGIIIVATGAEEVKSKEYHYGQNLNVLTLWDLEDVLNKGDNPLAQIRNLVMIQCVGSRNKERPYCSQDCCSQAIKCALRIKELNPDANIFILYRDIMTYGFKEDYYFQAAKANVTFIRYNPDHPPQVFELGSKIIVTSLEPILNETIQLEADMLVLSTATIPQKDNETLAQTLKVPLNREGFFTEAHVKLRPVEFATEGIFLAGLAHYPKPVEEIISQAQAAAARAATVLSKERIEIEATISTVRDDVCDGCAYCAHICPFEAITLMEYIKNGEIKRIVDVNESRCKGCGICMATCPKRGIYIKDFRMHQFEAMIEAALTD